MTFLAQEIFYRTQYEHERFGRWNNIERDGDSATFGKIANP